jgi:hypothetical protein
MIARYIAVDGMLSGTGIRDTVVGGSIDLDDLGVSQKLSAQIREWLQRYEAAHYAGLGDRNDLNLLDMEGIKISQSLQGELPESKIRYYSHGLCAFLPIPML